MSLILLPHSKYILATKQLWKPLVKASLLIWSFHGVKFTCILKNVFLVQNLRYHLLSVKVITKGGFTVSFSETRCEITRNHKLFASGTLKNNLYYLNTHHSKASEHKVMVANLSLWHARFAHVNIGGIKQLASSKIVDGLKLHGGKDPGQCSACVYGKRGRDPIPKESNHRRVIF